jgi:hypothetical protein
LFWYTTRKGTAEIEKYFGDQGTGAISEQSSAVGEMIMHHALLAYMAQK